MEKFYIREYIPGYTGHIQQKLNTFAMTAGEINRQLVLSQQPRGSVPIERQYYTKCITRLHKDGDRDKYGYKSRHAISWISGPTSKVYTQHIPCMKLLHNSVSRICSLNYT